ncbi:DUF3082 domain-containing protein [Baaleninema simplex]|uniref:DUF3082 domain-containing protein n=1 Tax=Baaleninema simplex TaxID=2862350 RepID=UPI00034B8C61|nr:DUF3082 domain-containing protein [Baaleninema simplex]
MDDTTKILRSFSGSLISATIALLLYRLTNSIVQTFADKPLHTDNTTALNIASAVRTLVMGLSALATFIFAFSALGLLLFGLQTLIQKVFGNTSPPE